MDDTEPFATLGVLLSLVGTALLLAILVGGAVLIWRQIL